VSDFKDLNLDRDKLNENILEFIAKCNYSIEGEISLNNNKKRVKFGRIGSPYALVDLSLNKSGGTTVQFKQGANPELGEQLAEYLKSTMDDKGFETVNLVLQGVSPDELDALVSELIENTEVQSDINEDTDTRKVFKFTHTKHGDNITVTHHKTTLNMQVQGRPLACYRRFMYLLTELLDLPCLERVLCLKDDGKAEIVRPEMATSYLRGKLQNSFDKLPSKVQHLLVSGCCVKLAAPQLQEYSLLLFPDLRALEGVTRLAFSDYNLYVSDQKFGFGAFFDGDNPVKMKDDFANIINCPEKVNAIENAYDFLKKHRNTLFHMDDNVNASRVIDTLDKAIALSDDVYDLIDGIYLT
jgi:hypothetical protein